VFFGGLDGITVVAPDASSDWTYAPPLVATALRLGRRDVPVVAVNRGGATVDLPADARDISVEFSALDYSAPQALHYEYRLDGYDADWIHADATHRIATYTNLSPGNYTLEVRGTNRLGVWSSHELRLGIGVPSPWYATWWFRALLVALIVLAAYGVDRVRTAVLRRRQGELEALVGDRTLELSEANTKLRELSLSDPLTGLRNRRFLDQHIESDIVMAQRRYDDWREDPSNEPPRDTDIVFFLIDLDNFKTVNDRYGHHGGDALLLQMRERLQEVFRESDFVVRWGGDEFLTVARGSTRVDAGNLAERIRLAVAGRPFSLGNEQRIDATVSIGFATFPFIETAPGALSWFHVITLADHALYMAKLAGRNAWFGLAATPATDPRVLIENLERPAEELVAAAALEVIAYDTATVTRPG
jgi:diguanylate cyclase (GGDEF)-like protein